jgi:polar amino acid transport system substrate-binding protein
MRFFQLMSMAICFCSLVCGSALAYSIEPLKFARCENLPETDVTEIIIRRVMKNINVPVRIISYPAARVTQEILSGNAIGEIERIKSYGDKHSSLLRVTPPIYYLVSAVYAKKNRHIVIHTKKDLAHYSVGVVRGIQHSDDAVEGLHDVVRITNSKNLFKMLQAERMDLLITSEIDGRMQIRNMKLSNDIELVGELAHLDTFIYLSPHASSLQEKISQELIRMKKSGELQQVAFGAEAQLEALASR